MKKIRSLRTEIEVFLLSFFLLLAAVQEAEASSSSEQDYMCAWLSLASYDDRIGQIARSELAADGWDMKPFTETTKKADATYYLIRQSQPGGKVQYMLSVMGTASWKDVKTDLRFGKVPFGGKTPDEFRSESARKTMTADEPLVHGGFNAYTDTAFFTEQADGGTVAETLRDALLAQSESRICITGHSLGGAVAVLLAARLSDMGVPAEQMDVVTFGAPAVGNEAFVRKFSHLNIRRVTMEGDPVKDVLQSIGSGYTQIGSKIALKAPKGSERFPHDMAGYVDGMLREYYDTVPADFMLPEEASPRVFFVASASLDEPIAADAPYLTRAAAQLLFRQIPGLVVGTEVPDTFYGIAEAARAKGCRYAVVHHYETERKRMSRGYYDYNVTLVETVLDSRGGVLAVQSMTTSTDRMPVILAGLYNSVAGREMRDAALGLAK